MLVCVYVYVYDSYVEKKRELVNKLNFTLDFLPYSVDVTNPSFQLEEYFTNYQVIIL